MEEKLSAKDAEHPGGWAQDRPEPLFDHLLCEVGELQVELTRRAECLQGHAFGTLSGERGYRGGMDVAAHGHSKAAAGEAVDVANMAMMVASVLLGGLDCDVEAVDDVSTERAAQERAAQERAESRLARFVLHARRLLRTARERARALAADLGSRLTQAQDAHAAALARAELAEARCDVLVRVAVAARALRRHAAAPGTVTKWALADALLEDRLDAALAAAVAVLPPETEVTL